MISCEILLQSTVPGNAPILWLRREFCEVATLISTNALGFMGFLAFATA